jgi:anti-sigma B factor antagonist
MEIVERTVNDVTVLDLKGKMTLGEGDEMLKEKINSLLAAGKKKLLLNLEAVPYIDSQVLARSSGRLRRSAVRAAASSC